MKRALWLAGGIAAALSAAVPAYAAAPAPLQATVQVDSQQGIRGAVIVTWQPGIHDDLIAVMKLVDQKTPPVKMPVPVEIRNGTCAAPGSLITAITPSYTQAQIQVGKSVVSGAAAPSGPMVATVGSGTGAFCAALDFKPLPPPQPVPLQKSIPGATNPHTGVPLGYPAAGLVLLAGGTVALWKSGKNPEA